MKILFSWQLLSVLVCAMLASLAIFALPFISVAVLSTFLNLIPAQSVDVKVVGDIVGKIKIIIALSIILSATFAHSVTYLYYKSRSRLSGIVVVVALYTAIICLYIVFARGTGDNVVKGEFSPPSLPTNPPPATSSTPDK